MTASFINDTVDFVFLIVTCTLYEGLELSTDALEERDIFSCLTWPNVYETSCVIVPVKISLTLLYWCSSGCIVALCG